MGGGAGVWAGRRGGEGGREGTDTISGRSGALTRKLNLLIVRGEFNWGQHQPWLSRDPNETSRNPRLLPTK